MCIRDRNSSVSGESLGTSPLPDNTQLSPLNIQGEKTNFMFFSASLCNGIVDEFKSSYDKQKQDLEGKLDSSYKVMEKGGYDPKVLFDDKVWNINNIFILSDSFLAQVFNDSSFKFTWEEFLHMDVIHTIRENIHSNNDRVAEVSMTPMYNQWISQIEKMENYLKSPKKYEKPETVNLFSGHDMTLTTIFKGLIKDDNSACMIDSYEKNVKNAVVTNKSDYQKVMTEINKGDCLTTVAFASQIILEFYTNEESITVNHNIMDLKNSSKELFVKFWFNNKEISVNGKTSMSAKDFKSFLNTKKVKNFEKECDSSFFEDKNPQKTKKIIALVAIGFAFLVVLAVLILILFMKKKPKHNSLSDDNDEMTETMMDNE